MSSIWDAEYMKFQPLVEFRAGLCHRKGKMVVPDKRKGRVMVTKEDQILHFKYYDSASRKKALDLMLFPGEATIKKIEAVKDGRVLLLFWTQSKKEIFMWLQSPDASEDAQILEKFKKLIADPSQTTEVASQQEQMYKGFQERRKQQMEAKATQKTAKGLDFGMFSEALKGVGLTPNFTKDELLGKKKKKDDVRLDEVLDRKIIGEELKRDKEMVEELSKHLPEGTAHTAQDIEKHIRSPQFAQSVKYVDMALGTGQIDGKTLDLDVPRGMNNIEDIVSTLHKKADKEKKDDKKEEKKDDKKEDKKDDKKEEKKDE